MALTDQQKRDIRVLEWLYGPSRQSGRSLAQAIALIRVGLRSTGMQVRVVDHSNGGQRTNSMLLEMIQALVRADPRLEPCFHPCFTPCCFWFTHNVGHLDWWPEIQLPEPPQLITSRRAPRPPATLDGFLDV